MSAKIFVIWTQNESSIRIFQSILVSNNWALRLTSDLINTLKNLSIDEGHSYCLAILSPLNHVFTVDELSAIKKFHEAGGGLLVVSSEDENEVNETNINSIVSEFGIRFLKNCVIRPNPCELNHPKESTLEGFIVNRALKDAFDRHIKRRSHGSTGSATSVLSEVLEASRIVYPFGCTMQVDRNSVVMMTSSKLAIPTCQPICAFNQPVVGVNAGRVATFGSGFLFSDSYIDRESNRALVMALLDYLEDKNFTINISDAKTIEIPELNYTPDINYLVELPASCLQGSRSFNKDPTELIERSLFNIDSSKLISVIRAYHDLAVPHKALTLIKPKFQRKFLDLEPATHGFRLSRINPERLINK